MAQPRYQYGTSPRKISPDADRRTKATTPKKELKVIEKVPQKKVSAEQRKKEIRITLTVASIFILLLTISARNSLIDKKFSEIQDQKKQLAAIQKENEQLRVSIENSLNLSNIAKVAKEELGMEKLTNKQIVYVTLPKKDYIESASEKVIIEEQEKGWFQKLIDKILNF